MPALHTLAAVVILMGIAATRVDAAQLRTLPTTGLTRTDLGGGISYFTNAPGAVVTFSWNTGSTRGAAILGPSGITIGQ